MKFTNDRFRKVCVMARRKNHLQTEGSTTKISQNGTPLRQMTITESFKKAKMSSFKMEKPFLVSDVVIEINSESEDEDTPPFDFNCDRTSDSKASIVEPMAGPSPTKKPRTTMSVCMPTTSTPKNASAALNLATDSPESVISNGSERTLPYDYTGGTSFDASTIPFSPSGKTHQSSSKIAIKEVLVLNDPKNFEDDITQNAVDSFPLTPPTNRTQLGSNQCSKSDSDVRRQLSFGTSFQASSLPCQLVTNNNNSVKSTGETTKKPNASTARKPRRKISKEKAPPNIEEVSPKRKNLSSIVDRLRANKDLIIIEASDNLKGTSNNLISNSGKIGKGSVSKPPPSQMSSSTKTPSRKRKSQDTSGQNNAHNKENSVKPNKAHQQSNVSKSFGDAITEILTRSVSISNQPVNKKSAERNNNVKQIPVSSKEPSNTSTDNIRVSSTSKKIVTKTPGSNYCLTVTKSSDLKELKTAEADKSQSLLTPTKVNEKPTPCSSKSLQYTLFGTSTTIISTSLQTSKKVAGNAQNSNSKSLNPNDQSNALQTGTTKKIAANSFISKSPVSNNQSTLFKTSPISTNPSLQPPKKLTINGRPIPCSSKSLTPNGQSTSLASKEANICTTPTKQTPLKVGSPTKRGYIAPSKNREIKNLEAKKGKELQVKQLDLLVELFETVARNRHLKSLLNVEEYSVVSKFVRMTDKVRYVIMKLYIWKRLWYNIFKFCTKAHIVVDDDKDKIEIFESLKKENFVDTDYQKSGDMVDLLNELDVQQLKELVGELMISPNKKSTKKTELIHHIVMATSTQTTLTRRTLKEMVMDTIAKKLGFAIRLRDDVYDAFHHLYLLATFTNPEFDDIQKYFRNIIHLRVTFPLAPIEDYPVFYSRNKFVNFAQAVKTRRKLDEHLDEKPKPIFAIYTIGEQTYRSLQDLDLADDARDHAIAPHLKRFTAAHVYSSVLTICCEKIATKNNGKPEEVKKWLEYLIRRFPQSRRLGDWYYSLIWLHMKHLEDISYARAAELLIEALDSKQHLLGQRAKYRLGSLGPRLKSSKKHRIVQMYHDRVALVIPRAIDTSTFPQESIDSQCIRSDVSGKKRVYLSKNNEETTLRHVEHVALQHYAENGYPGGEHCEGSSIKALLMLYFWDIIYNPERSVPGTFISKLQSAPLDFRSPYFYKNRQDAIDTRLREIAFQWSENNLIEFGADNWQKHSHEMSAFGMIMKDIEDAVTVEILVTVIGRKILAKIFERLIKDIGQFSSGLPDLLVWNVDQNIHKFVEVKGEGDELALHQSLWLRYLQSIGASIEVCRVHSLGSKRKKMKKSNVSSVENDNEVASTSGHDGAG